MHDNVLFFCLLGLLLLRLCLTSTFECDDKRQRLQPTSSTSGLSAQCTHEYDTRSEQKCGARLACQFPPRAVSRGVSQRGRCDRCYLNSKQQEKGGKRLRCHHIAFHALGMQSKEGNETGKGKGKRSWVAANFAQRWEDADWPSPFHQPHESLMLETNELAPEMDPPFAMPDMIPGPKEEEPAPLTGASWLHRGAPYLESGPDDKEGKLDAQDSEDDEEEAPLNPNKQQKQASAHEDVGVHIPEEASPRTRRRLQNRANHARWRQRAKEREERLKHCQQLCDEQANEAIENSFPCGCARGKKEADTLSQEDQIRALKQEAESLKRQKQESTARMKEWALKWALRLCLTERRIKFSVISRSVLSFLSIFRRVRTTR